MPTILSRAERTLKRNSIINPDLVSDGSYMCSHQFCTLIEGHDSVHADVSSTGFVFEVLDTDEAAPNVPGDDQLELELDL